MSSTLNSQEAHDAVEECKVNIPNMTQRINRLCYLLHEGRSYHLTDANHSKYLKNSTEGSKRKRMFGAERWRWR